MVTKWPWSEQSYLEEILATIRSLDSNHRLVDMNSGGPANKLGLGDVNDQHLYTDPRDVPITKGQYGERSTLAYVRLVSCPPHAISVQEWSASMRTSQALCLATSGSRVDAPR